MAEWNRFCIFDTDMYLEKITILNFKNIAEATLELSARVNCFVGSNGMGKSNLLESVNYLSMARSFTSLPDSALIRHGEDMFMVQGQYQRNGVREDVSCGAVKGKRKVLKRNGKEYQRISEHIGEFPIVIVSPQDSFLITGTGEERRKLLDMVISQADKSYLSHLIRYTKALEQRNKMLRVGFRDKLLYDSIESQMEEASNYIHSTRCRWVAETSEIFTRYYQRISGDQETSSIGYKSSLNEASLKEILEQSRGKDEVLGYTSKGIHRDDLEMGLGDYNMRRLGSQGQMKTFTIALRFAIFEFLKKSSGITPLLLLDDIFDKLDAGRVERIMQIVSSEEMFGQIFITDTNRKHIDEILSHIGGDYRLMRVENGNFQSLTTSQP